jgi:hypothetical protein
VQQLVRINAYHLDPIPHPLLLLLPLLASLAGIIEIGRMPPGSIPALIDQTPPSL